MRSIAVANGLVFSGSESGTIAVTSVESGERVAEIKDFHIARVNALAIDNGKLYSASTQLMVTLVKRVQYGVTASIKLSDINNCVELMTKLHKPYYEMW